MSSLNQSCGLLGANSAISDLAKLTESFHHIGNWYSGALGCSTQTTQALTVNTLRASPMMVKDEFTAIRLQFEVTTLGALARCIMGIYDTVSVKNVYPKNRIAQGSIQDCSSTGLKVDTISVTLLANTLYWFVYSCDVAFTVRALATANVKNVLGGSGIANSNTLYTIWSIANAYDGTLPLVFPAGATNPTLINVPFVQVKSG